MNNPNCPVCTGKFTQGLVDALEPGPGRKRGNSIDVYLHGRREITDVVCHKYELEGSDAMEDDPRLPIRRTQGQTDPRPSPAYKYILGSVPDPQQPDYDLVPGVRVGMFLVFGDENGQRCAVASAPTMHIIHDYCARE